MKIERIAIRDFRNLEDEVVFEGIGAGVTVVCGDNEAGKSTFLRAIQAAFFDRHTLMGEKLDAMLPYGSEGAAPTIEMTFTIGGAACALTKSFRPRQRAEMTHGGRRLQGDAVEEKLAELLRFTPPGKGAAKADNRGIWSLFWVEQGTAFLELSVNDDAKRTLQQTFEGQIGMVLGGERGARLTKAVQLRLADHFTAQGREKGRVKELRQKLGETGEDLAHAQGELRKLDDQMRDLAKVEARIRERERSGTAKLRQDAVREAAGKQSQIEALRRRAEVAAGELKVAAAAYDAASGAWSRRQAAIKKLADAAGRLATLESEAAARKLAFEAAERSKAVAAQRAKQAEDALAAGERRVRDAESALERGQLAQTLAAIDERLARAEAARAAMTEAEAAAKAIAVDGDAKRKIDRLAARAQQARAALESAAATVVFEPAERQGVARDGAAVAPGAPHVVTAATRFALEGFGAVQIRPGGGIEIEERQDEAMKADRALAKALAELGLARPEDAAERYALREAHRNTAAGASSRLDGIAPEGIDALRAAAAEAAARRAALGTPDEPPGTPEALAAARNDATDALDALRKDSKEAEAALKRADTALSDARVANMEAATLLSSHQQSMTADRVALEADRAVAGDEALQRHLAEAAAGREAARLRHEADAAAYDRADPEKIKLELANAEAALSAFNKDARDDETKQAGLRAALGTLGAQGFGEEAMKLEGERTRLAAELATVERESRALRLLADTLEAKQREAREQFTEPVRARIRPYLRLLFPETEIGIDEETFGIAHLRRGAVDEQFESLSLGTREQIAVLVRLAFAEYLAETGEAPVVILDDALVNCDPERMHRMLLALRKASQRLQIILLTCREADCAGLGAPVIRLGEQRSRAAERRP